MNDLTMEIMAKMAEDLTKLIIKGTTTSVQSKIKSIKNETNVQTIRTTYDEIVNQLLDERDEAIRIAKVYKEEVDKIEISDEDIAHLHNTVSSLLDILKKTSDNQRQFDSFEQIKDLISVDTLKTMQLLGFNYKAAIGQPLTELCANYISSLGKKGQKNRSSKN